MTRFLVVSDSGRFCYEGRYTDDQGYDTPGSAPSASRWRFASNNNPMLREEHHSEDHQPRSDLHFIMVSHTSLGKGLPGMYHTQFILVPTRDDVATVRAKTTNIR